MGKFKIALHIQILLALVLGSIFGSIFSIDHNKLLLNYLKNSKEIHKEISNWNKIIFYDENGIAISEFGKSDQLKIIANFKKINDSQKSKIKIEIINKNNERIFFSNDVYSISKVNTIAVQIKPIGDIFIRLLSFLAIPMVLASLIVGAASIDDIKKLGRIGTKTFAFYMITTAIAIIIGLTVANIIQPGNLINPASKERLLSTFQNETAEKIAKNVEIDIVDFFVNIVPKNPFAAIAEGNMLQIVFFAVVFGMMLTFISKDKSAHVINFFDAMSDTMIKLVEYVMKIAPFGVFCLISATVADFGFDILSTLIWYMFAVILGLFLQTIIVYPAIIKYFGKSEIIPFFKAMREAIAIAFSTSSSAATLPVTMKCVEQNLGIPKKISGFVLPLGATINMDGTALYQGVATLFIAQVYGIDLGITGQITVVLTAVLASIGTAPVPGVGLIMLVMILQSVHVPAEGIALIIGVDRLLDMLRTIPNILGDASISMAIAAGEKSKN